MGQPLGGRVDDIQHPCRPLTADPGNLPADLADRDRIGLDRAAQSTVIVHGAGKSIVQFEPLVEHGQGLGQWEPGPAIGGTGGPFTMAVESAHSRPLNLVITPTKPLGNGVRHPAIRSSIAS
ncbi:hypothetical protein P0F65_14650 [Sphingomonas sp. I4]